MPSVPSRVKQIVLASRRGLLTFSAEAIGTLQNQGFQRPGAEAKRHFLTIVLHFKVKGPAIPAQRPLRVGSGGSPAPGNDGLRVVGDLSQQRNLTVEDLTENVPPFSQVSDGSMSHDQVSGRPPGFQGR